MDPPRDFPSLQEGIQGAVRSTVKTANRIAGKDLGFERTADPAVADALDNRTARILDLSTRLLGSAAKACGIKAPKLEDAEDVDLNWSKVVDVIDSLLEKSSTAMDEYSGAIKRTNTSAHEKTPQTSKWKGHDLERGLRNANMPKPQLAFDHKPDNFAPGPWKPILTRKPHAQVPLEEILNSSGSDGGSAPGGFRHPYEIEILEMAYPAFAYEPAEAIMYQPVETTNAIWVDTYEGVLEMLEELKKAKEIAVDLEHHDFRTYYGLLSLMQISIREKDWIVDTLKPWRRQLEVLNEVFADPSIIKVFHGSFMDIQWLQRDLGLYVVGLFDTFHASALLQFPQKSLAYLLKRFVDFDADKKYQVADWRIRPLPEEMLYYARSDTHYLLYIFDHLRNMLLESNDPSQPGKDRINFVLEKSKEEALARYQLPTANPETGDGARGWQDYLFKHPFEMSGSSFAVFCAIWNWRDNLARVEDESPNYIMANHMVMQVAQALPPDELALHGLVGRNRNLAKSRLGALWPIVRDAAIKGGPTFFEHMAQGTTSLPDGKDSNGKESAGQEKTSAVSTLEATAQVEAMQIVDRAEPAVGKTLDKSQLFGDVAMSSLWEGSKEQGSHDRDEKLVLLPWQRVIGGPNTILPIMADTELAPVADSVMDTTTNVPDSGDVAGLNPPDEEFTLKAGRKRKNPMEDVTSSHAEKGSSALSGDEETSEEPDEDDNEEDAEAEGQILFDPEDSGRRQNRGNRRKNNKKAKGGKKTQDSDEAPFDYSKASSVLHANRGASTSGKKKAFNPYAGKLEEEGPKAARKAPPQNGGRSATFRK